MIFNESNIKVIYENGYLYKYVNKIAPYFPFTEEDVKNAIIILRDIAYYDNGIFYLTRYINNTAYFNGFSSKGSLKLSFNFITMRISSIEYPWGEVN